jgi:predicted translin family RNA/ssDNA-binding protein
MINKKFIQQLKSEHDAHAGESRQIVSLANAVLHDAKKAIFSLHRGDMAGAGKTFEEIEVILKNLENKFSLTRLHEEGAYKAAVEEYAEAKMFFLVMTGGKVDKIKEVNLDYESYLGGLSDLIGELVRLAVKMATLGKAQEVKKIHKVADAVMAELVEFDMRNYLRTKYDQAKGHLRKIEQINYEMTLRK